VTSIDSPASAAANGAALISYISYLITSLIHVWTQTPQKKKWRSLQTFISKKLKSTVKNLKQDRTFMPLSKLPIKVSDWKMPSALTYGPVAY